MSDDPRTEALTPEEWAILRGIAACQEAVEQQFRGFLGGTVFKRLNIHPSVNAKVDLNDGSITLVPDAPKVEAPVEPKA